MTSESSEYKSIVIESESSAVGRVFEHLLGEAREHGFGKDDLFAIHLALEEAIVNAIKHGNDNDPTQKIRIRYLINDEKFEVSIADSGKGFRPDEVPDPRLEENLYKPCGRGMLLMKSYMDTVEYNKAGNEVHMLKYKSSKTDN